MASGDSLGAADKYQQLSEKVAYGTMRISNPGIYSTVSRHAVRPHLHDEIGL